MPFEKQPCMWKFTRPPEANRDSVDMVNHPPHYQHCSGVEVITITQHMNFLLGNVVKYVLREKGARLEDLKKARWYLDRQIALMEGSDGQGRGSLRSDQSGN